MARRRSEFQKSEVRTPIEFQAACGHGLSLPLMRHCQNILVTRVTTVAVLEAFPY
jgi:hypothetical protein